MKKFLWKPFAVALVGTGAICTQTLAALTIDLRWVNGSHSTYPDGQTGSATINAWATVTGSGGNSNREGLQSVIFGIKSVVQYGNILGGITSASLAPGWNGSGSSIGVATNLSNDGVGDWGNVSNNTIAGTSTFFRARTAKAVNNPIDWGDSDSPAGSVFNNLADGGREFLIGSFTFSWTSFPSGQYPNLAAVQFVPLTPLGGTTAPATWYEDTTDVTFGIPTGGKNHTTGVLGPATPNPGSVNAAWIGVLPEPASLGWAGLLGLGLIRRRR